MSLPLVRIGDGAERGDRPVLLIAQAGYHLDELVPLRDELRARDIAASIAVPEPPRRPLHRFRPAVRRHRQLLGAMAHRSPVGEAVDVSELVVAAGALVVMNDWGFATAPLVGAARSAGVPTIGWVEGVQDFGDVDTGRVRLPYRSVDHVLSLGHFDAGQLEGAAVTVAGSSRLRALWEAPPDERPGDLAAVNCNFTYRVLEDRRRGWLRSVRRACRAAGVPFRVSQHAADRAVLDPRTRTTEPISALLGRSLVFVSRFSTVCYESLVRGVPLAYHNPHGELVSTFSEPMGAFDVTTSDEELTEVLHRDPTSRADVRTAAQPFLEHHLRLSGPAPPEVAADIVAELRAGAT